MSSQFSNVKKDCHMEQSDTTQTAKKVHPKNSNFVLNSFVNMGFWILFPMALMQSAICFWGERSKRCFLSKHRLELGLHYHYLHHYHHHYHYIYVVLFQSNQSVNQIIQVNKISQDINSNQFNQPNWTEFLGSFDQEMKSFESLTGRLPWFQQSLAK